MADKRLLAIDLGASSGRGIVGLYDGKKINLKEIHRFSNDPVSTCGGFWWDTLRLLFEIKNSILSASHDGGVDTIGIDTWGVDYGYIDKAGMLLSSCFQYRDERTSLVIDDVYSKMPYNKLYGITGIESMSFNTIFQVVSDLKTRPWVVEAAETLLLTPDLLGYFLTGEKTAEYTIASTTAMMDAVTRQFSNEVLDAIGFPDRLLPTVSHPGATLGKLLTGIDTECGNTGATVVNIASHDTSSAVLAVPAEEEDFLFISSGTWSLMGTESSTPVINEISEKYSFTNEGGAFGKINIMKNIMGLWLLQESRRQWKREGKSYTFDDLSKMALECTPCAAIIDPDDPIFGTSGNIPKRIREYCARTNQHIPESDGEIVRCIFDSLSLRYRWTAEKLEKLTGRKYNTINIVGGGTKETLLCCATADATGRRVIAGPTEATALGNIAMQAVAAGEFSSASDVRGAIRTSFDLKEYIPDTSSKNMWDDAYARFLSLI